MPQPFFSHLAKVDLREIIEYISSDNPDAAQSLFDSIHHHCKLIAEFPGMGRLRDEFRDRTLRSFAVGNYLIIYKPISPDVEIVRILHGARDMDRLVD